jgi:hypothetical protein
MVTPPQIQNTDKEEAVKLEPGDCHTEDCRICITISNLISRKYHFALFFNFCIRERTKIPTMTGLDVDRWPPLHRPGVTRTEHVDSRFTGHVPITIITNSQRLLTSSLHHQHTLTMKKSM